MFGKIGFRLVSALVEHNQQMSMILLLAIAVVLVCTACADASPPSTPTPTARDVVTGLDTPWEILWGPDDRIWMTERRGVVSTVDPSTGERRELLTIPEVVEESESGLMGMELHPDFDQTPFVYLAYTYRSQDGLTVRVVRYTYDAAGHTLTSPQVLVDNIQGYAIHDGCRLLFAPDGTLHITTGDAGTAELAQQWESLNGKTLRINADGSIPSDNPRPGSPVWSIGHRNAQGITFGPDGTLYSSEHGPASDDELNILHTGSNYGWPEVKGRCNSPAEKAFCRDHSVVEPIAVWTPTLAVCGLEYYDHEAFPQWRNSLLLVCLKAKRLVRLAISDDGSSIAEQHDYYVNEFGRLRDLCISPDGRIFLATSNRDGRGDPRAIDDRIVEVTPQDR